jgi:hypothetical protein
MKKYIIEGGIDFFDELYKSVENEKEDAESTNEKDNENACCLITNQPLTEKWYEMSCGHKFNYIPLYKDIVNHKKQFNCMEGSSGRLNSDEIRCPYCRTKQSSLLPYYEEFGLQKIHGVNFIDPNKLNPMKSIFMKCEFLTLNLHFDPSSNVIESNPNYLDNCKYFPCSNMGSKINFINESILDVSDEKYYCWYHKKQVIKKYKKEKADKIKCAKMKEKEEAKLAKMKEKEEAKLAKTKVKKWVKIEKPCIKKYTTLQNIVDNVDNSDVVCNSDVVDTVNYEENVVIGIVDITKDGTIENKKCHEILKYGSNKGSTCKAKIFTENVCKRHYNCKKDKEEK